MIKICPDLTGYEEYESPIIGGGKFKIPKLRQCLKNECIAYKNGCCLKYDNDTEKNEAKEDKE